jgi:adenine deaminase
MDHALRLLLEGGVAPIDAFRIACQNPARWFGIRSMGAIAPGYAADFVAFESFEDFRPRLVFKDGRLVAEDGRLLVESPDSRPPARDSVNIKWLTEEDFRIPAERSPAGAIRPIRAIEARPGSIITGERILEPKVEDGLCVADVSRDLVKIFVIERHTGSGNIGKGFITGLGLKRGAIGLTISHDSHNMIVAGVDDLSIFKAAKRLNKLKGGMVFAVGDDVVLDLPLPIAGLMSDQGADFVVERLRAFEEIFEKEGLSNKTPLMTLSFMALPVIPKLRITDRGLVDVERFAPVGLFAD